MADSRILVVNKPSVVAEVIEAELVAIQLETGCYYHANSTGGTVWGYIEQGIPQTEIVLGVKKRYGIDEQLAGKDVDAFVERLLQEKLVRIAENEVIKESAQVSFSGLTEPYTEPTLKKHEDMKELLLLDPIHDIGESAWPMQPVQ